MVSGETRQESGTEEDKRRRNLKWGLIYRLEHQKKAGREPGAREAEEWLAAEATERAEYERLQHETLPRRLGNFSRRDKSLWGAQMLSLATTVGDHVVRPVTELPVDLPSP